MFFKPKSWLFLSAIFFASQSLFAQQDSATTDEEEFDFSDFEPAASPEKSFCNNKVLGQSPTQLVAINYTFQGPHNFTAGNPLDNELGANPDLSEANDLRATHEFTLSGNFPVLSRNNILINLGATYSQQQYQFTNDWANHPFIESLQANPLRSAATVATVFKPLNDKRFILGQVGVSFNGDYNFSDFSQSINTLRYSAALMYGFKPHDRLMYAFGVARTYLGGSLNYLPIVYYYHTFKSEKWGIEALLPSRALLRYRFNSTSLMGAGFTVLGNTYRLNYFSSYPGAEPQTNPLAYSTADELELRRSEIRLGLSYSRAIKGFFWFTAEGGYRLNYSYDVDRGGDFLRLLGNDDPYYIENNLGNPVYFTIGVSYVSP